MCQYQFFTLSHNLHVAFNGKSLWRYRIGMKKVSWLIFSIKID